MACRSHDQDHSSEWGSPDPPPPGTGGTRRTTSRASQRPARRRCACPREAERAPAGTSACVAGPDVERLQIWCRLPVSESRPESTATRRAPAAPCAGNDDQSDAISPGRAGGRGRFRTCDRSGVRRADNGSRRPYQHRQDSAGALQWMQTSHLIGPRRPGMRTSRLLVARPRASQRTTAALQVPSRRPGAARPRGRSWAALDAHRTRPCGALPTGGRVVALREVVGMARPHPGDLPARRGHERSSVARRNIEQNLETALCTQSLFASNISSVCLSGSAVDFCSAY
jgi:hypothetical protein